MKSTQTPKTQKNMFVIHLDELQRMEYLFL